MPRLIKYKNYYDGVQKILQKKYADESKPCNRTVSNFCKNITDAYCGYLAAPGYISYTSENDIEDIIKILNYNDYQAADADLLLNALIYGVGSELMFLDNDAQVRFKVISPLQSFGIFDDSLTNDLLYFVRFYAVSPLGEAHKPQGSYKVDVYSNTSIKHYIMNENLTFVGEEAHFFNQCPANIFFMPDERSIFDCIIGLQDSYNELLTSEIDDYAAFVDAFLILNGVDADADDIVKMKENRVLILPEGASANWLTKNASDAQIENILKRIHDNIYRIANCPDFSSETFAGGVSSGVALRFRLCGMENRAANIAAAMKKALQRRVEIICGIASLRLGEEVFRDININMKRNIPNDDSAIATVVNSYRGLVSDETLLSMIPQVDNPIEEIEKVKAQKQENMSLYSFEEEN